MAKKDFTASTDDVFDDFFSQPAKQKKRLKPQLQKKK